MFEWPHNTFTKSIETYYPYYSLNSEQDNH